MGTHLHREHEVARRSALVAGVALATEPDLLTILDTDRDARGDPGTIGSAQRHGRALDRVAERQRGTSLDVLATAWSRRGTTTPITLRTLRSEHTAEQVLEIWLPGATTASAEANIATGAAATTEQVAVFVNDTATTATGAAGGEPGPTVAHRADGVVLLALLGGGQDG